MSRSIPLAWFPGLISPNAVSGQRPSPDAGHRAGRPDGGYRAAFAEEGLQRVADDTDRTDQVSRHFWGVKG